MAAKIKPVKAWGFVDINGELHRLVYANRKAATEERFGGERVVRVEIRVIEPKRRKSKGRK